MDDLTLLTQAEHELSRVIGELADAELELVSNCPPWTVRRLASHAIKNQLFWAGLVTGHDLMPQDEAMAAVPYEGELGPIAAEASTRVVELWHSDGVMTRPTTRRSVRAGRRRHQLRPRRRGGPCVGRLRERGPRHRVPARVDPWDDGRSWS